MDELIKFRAYSYNDEKIDTFSFDIKKDVKLDKNKKKYEVDVKSEFGQFLKNKVQ